MFEIVGELEEPIYIRYKSDFETFYNSVIIVNIAEELDVEIVEEYESFCALNSVANYIIQANSKLNLSTFYHRYYRPPLDRPAWPYQSWLYLAPNCPDRPCEPLRIRS